VIPSANCRTDSSLASTAEIPAPDERSTFRRNVLLYDTGSTPVLMDTAVGLGVGVGVRLGVGVGLGVAVGVRLGVGVGLGFGVGVRVAVGLGVGPGVAGSGLSYSSTRLLPASGT
jgi:hypothetical protein